MNNIQWIKIDEQQAQSSSISYTDYINPEGTMVRREWSDGFIEEYEVG